MKQVEALASKLNATYDAAMFDPAFIDFYEQSDFANYGYWDAQTTGADRPAKI